MGEDEQAVILKRESQHLTCQLKVAERNERGQELAATIEEISNETSAQESQKKSMKARLALLEANRDVLASVVRSGKETREVEVHHVMNPKTLRVTTYRMDTGEAISERQATEKEQQIEMPLTEESPAPVGA